MWQWHVVHSLHARQLLAAVSAMQTDFAMGIRPLYSSEYSSLSTNGVMHVPLGFYTYSFYINLAESGCRKQPGSTLPAMAWKPMPCFLQTLPP